MVGIARDITEDALTIWKSSISSVNPKTLVKKHIRFSGSQLRIKDDSFPIQSFERILVIGGGKAGTEMSTGLMESIGDRVPVSGWINVPEGSEADLTGIVVNTARAIGLNEPTEKGVFGTGEMIKLLSRASERTLCIALISGGGSALITYPAEGLSLQNKLHAIRFLSDSGATIEELNTVRTHLSQVKGGRMAMKCKTQLVSVVLSDVLSDSLDIVASGPTVPCRTSPQDALEILERFDSKQMLPSSIYRVLKNTKTPQRHGHRFTQPFLVGNNRTAVMAAKSSAETLGYNAEASSAMESEGAAEQVGCELASWVSRRLSESEPTSDQCLISGGEPSVQLVASESRGKGGRNQHVVLSAYMSLAKLGLSSEAWQRLVLLSGGTDGEDGPTNAAGALIDANVHQRIIERGLDPSDFLHRNDSYGFFSKVGGLIVTGPTGTNVCDVRVAMVSGS